MRRTMAAHRMNTNETLARRAAAGDPDAFAELIERHYARIYRFGLRVLGDAEEAAEVAQDVCVMLPAKLARFRGDRGFTSWLYRVVVNAAHDARRRMSSRRRNEALHAELEMLRRAGETARVRQLAWLRQALDALPEDLRATAILVCDEGLRHAAAGEILGVSEATVSWRMHELRKRLRAMAAAEEEAVP